MVWLEVSPHEAARRIGDPNGRPLLAGGPPEARLSELLAARGPLYAEAAHRHVATDGLSADAVADAVLTAVSTQRV